MYIGNYGFMGLPIYPDDNIDLAEIDGLLW